MKRALAIAGLLAAFAVVAIPTLADAKGVRGGVAGVASPSRSGKSHGKPTIINPPKAKLMKSTGKVDKPRRGGHDGTSCCTIYAHGDVTDAGPPAKGMESGTDPRISAARLAAIMRGDKDTHRLDLCGSLPLRSQAGCMGW